eukprot:gene22078-biopygen17693
MILLLEESGLGEQDTGAGVARAVSHVWLWVARAWRGHILFPLGSDITKPPPPYSATVILGKCKRGLQQFEQFQQFKAVLFFSPLGEFPRSKQPLSGPQQKGTRSGSGAQGWCVRPHPPRGPGTRRGQMGPDAGPAFQRRYRTPHVVQTLASAPVGCDARFFLGVVADPVFVMFDTWSTLHAWHRRLARGRVGAGMSLVACARRLGIADTVGMRHIRRSDDWPFCEVLPVARDGLPESLLLLFSCFSSDSPTEHNLSRCTILPEHVPKLGGALSACIAGKRPNFVHVGVCSVMLGATHVSRPGMRPAIAVGGPKVILKVPAPEEKRRAGTSTCTIVRSLTHLVAFSPVLLSAGGGREQHPGIRRRRKATAGAFGAS